MKADSLERMLNDGDDLLVVDVRSLFEYASGHLSGAVHFPFWRSLFSLSELKREQPVDIILYCEHGPRAVLAKALLGLRGYRNLYCLEGHMHRWRREGRPLVK